LFDRSPCGADRLDHHQRVEFGEAVLWWGYLVIALGVGGWWTIFASALMTFLLVRVSGVALLERGLAARRPGYAEYIREVPHSSRVPRAAQALSSERP
jgi:steroid 5-alpha reductase family enzyme